jgi:sphingomyelin phosphodiesterase
MTIVSCRMEQNLPNDDNDESQNIQKLEEYFQLGGDQIKVLSYNTFLLRDIAPASTTQWSQNKRAEKLGDANFINNYDV